MYTSSQVHSGLGHMDKMQASPWRLPGRTPSRQKTMIPSSLSWRKVVGFKCIDAVLSGIMNIHITTVPVLWLSLSFSLSVQLF